MIVIQKNTSKEAIFCRAASLEAHPRVLRPPHLRKVRSGTPKAIIASSIDIIVHIVHIVHVVNVVHVKQGYIQSKRTGLTDITQRIVTGMYDRLLFSLC